MSVLHPYPNDIVLMHNFSGTLAPEIGGPFAADGCTLSTVGAIFGVSLDVGGTSPAGGGSNVLYSTGALADYDLNAGDFTIEGWWLFRSAPNRPRTLIHIADDSSAAGAAEYQLFSDGSPHRFFFGYPVGDPGVFTPTNNIDTGNAISLNTGIHMAMCRLGNVYTAYVQGVSYGSHTNAYRRAAGPKKVFIGNSRRSFVDALDGVIDAITITRRCLYTADFAPQGPYETLWPGAANVWPAGAPQ